MFRQRIGNQGFGQRKLARQAARALANLPNERTWNEGYRRQTRLERQTYRRQSLDLIRRVQRAGVASNARLPRLSFDNRYRSQDGYKVPSKTSWAAEVYRPGRRTIHVAPSTVEGAFGAGPTRRYDRNVVLHEWAHTLQRPTLGQTRTEGGAEDFKIMAERKARLRRSDRVYAAQRRAVRHSLRDHTGRFVRRDQFDPLLLRRRRRTPKNRLGFG